MSTQNDVPNFDFRGLETKNLTKFTPAMWRLIVFGIIILGFILIFTGQSQTNVVATKIGIMTIGFGIILGIVLEFLFRIRLI